MDETENNLADAAIILGSSFARVETTTEDEDETTATKAKKSLSSKSKRSSGYQSVEDLMVCKAYIAASEDPMSGAGQKVKDFERTIAKHYSTFIKKRVQ